MFRRFQATDTTARLFRSLVECKACSTLQTLPKTRHFYSTCGYHVYSEVFSSLCSTLLRGFHLQCAASHGLVPLHAATRPESRFRRLIPIEAPTAVGCSISTPGRSKSRDAARCGSTVCQRPTRADWQSSLVMREQGENTRRMRRKTNIKEPSVHRKRERETNMTKKCNTCYQG